MQLRIAEVLSEAGCSVVTGFEIKESNKCRGDERLSRWIVDQDSTLSEPAGKHKYNWYQIEINSPAFYFNQAAVDEVKTVCALLAKTFRIHINKSTGLHVHVGNGMKGLSTDKLRSLMAMLYVFEPQLNKLHPAHRGDRNIFCTSLNTHSVLGQLSVFQEITNPKPKTRSELLEKLLKISRRDKIIETMYQAPFDFSTYKLAYNLSNMMDGSKETIEFRQHESTLDPERVAMWVRTCVGLVEVMFRETRESIEAFLKLHVNDSVEDFDVIKFLLALNLIAEAEFYDARFYHFWLNSGEKSENEVSGPVSSENPISEQGGSTS